MKTNYTSVWRTSSIQQIDINQLIPTKPNSAEVESTLKTHRMIYPPQVVKTQDGYKIIAGNTKYYVAKELGYDTIDVIVHNTEDDALKMDAWHNQCNPHVNKNKQYRGVMDYSKIRKPEAGRPIDQNKEQKHIPMKEIKVPGKPNTPKR